MSSVFQRSFLVLAVVFVGVWGATVAAQEKPIKPPKEFQDLMKANTKIVAVDGSGGNASGSIADALENVGQENFEAIYRDAATLKANFAEIEKFFTERKFGDAIDYARAASAAISDIQRWAADGIWLHGNRTETDRISLEIQRAQLSLATTCRNCHIAHRVVTITVPVGFEIR
jgi:hypothetical protein